MLLSKLQMAVNDEYDFLNLPALGSDVRSDLTDAAGQPLFSPDYLEDYAGFKLPTVETVAPRPEALSPEQIGQLLLGARPFERGLSDTGIVTPEEEESFVEGRLARSRAEAEALAREYEGQLQARLEEMRALEREMEAANREILEARAEQDAIREQAARERLAALQEQEQRLTGEYKILEEQLASEREGFAGERSEFESRIGDLDARIAELLRERDQALAEQDNIRAQAAESQAQALQQQKEQMLAERQQIVGGLESQLADITSARDAALAERDQALAGNDVVRAQAAEAQAQALEQQRQELEAQYSQQISQLQGQVTSEQERFKQMQDELNTRLKNMGYGMYKKNEQIAGYQQQIADLQAQIDALQSGSSPSTGSEGGSQDRERDRGAQMYDDPYRNLDPTDEGIPGGRDSVSGYAGNTYGPRDDPYMPVAGPTGGGLAPPDMPSKGGGSEVIGAPVPRDFVPPKSIPISMGRFRPGGLGSLGGVR